MKQRIYTAILGAACMGMLITCVNLATAQTDPPALWHPADTPSYTVLRSQKLFDAEGESITGEYWSFDADAHSGAKAAKGTANQWIRPKVRFARTDLTWADELWLWAKPATEQPCSFQFGSWKGRTSGYTQVVLPEWTLVRIPLFGIDAGNEAFDSIEDLYFSAELNQPLLVDDVWAVKLGPPPTVEEPPVDPPVDPTPEHIVTWGEWHFAGFEIIEERTSSDGQQTQRRRSPLILKLGAPEVTP